MKQSRSAAKSRQGVKAMLTRWKRLPPAKRAETAAATSVALVLALALIVTGLRFAGYRLRVSTLRHAQTQSDQRYGFNPGNIISDGPFFDTTSMNADDVQAFLNTKGAACTTETSKGAQPCLKDYRTDAPTKPADGLCDEYQGGKDQSAATIIDGAARSCRISQRVLLAMLQKEQHLVSATTPTPLQYKAAMGLSCPDDADCDPAYAGFFNQVYGAAHRYRYYQVHMDEYQFKPGRINSVRYSPKASCGASDVYIENTATALLYIYTPYQPNDAALKAGVGEGDACSAYGNRNFAIIYDGWFGGSHGQGGQAAPSPKAVLRRENRRW
ncbi:hemagglutinin [Bifidobacterium xylocopae]|uniref:hemagglutinin n=1 Tax=Bifidobacterium xylocopae TaxID=2493119 RepID=UPI001F1F6269|nr:hemagglutinin [Bifidobacterium xylocopae]